MPLELLPTVQRPADLKALETDQLRQLCREIREYTIEVVTQTGGHLASTLGAVELTVALHYVYDAPRDKIVWDVGHQAYAHKLLTGRFEQLKTIRQYGGLSGFLKRSESEYDVFGAGHASTSISAALGIAIARDLHGEDFRVAAVIGDGAMTGGLAYEGLNNAGQQKRQLLVILNDNEMSISPNVGAIRTYLNRVVTNPLYNRIRNEIWDFTGALPVGTRPARVLLRKMEESLKNLVVPGIVFDELGFRYFGPIDGHDIEELIRTLQNIKDIPTPVLLHLITKKGKGMGVAEKDPIKYHGVQPNKNSKTRDKGQVTVSTTAPSFQNVFGFLACELARNQPEVVCITAAMREGTGLVPYSREFPDRYFDVGIAEGHAVTFAGGLATEGIRPIVAVYSTFLQRAFDHITHDVALQHLPVVFCLDRAGIAGEDGPTHHGTLDIAYLRCVQEMIVSAPRNGNEFRHLLYTALNQGEHPFAIRYPKAEAVEFQENQQAELLPIGSWEVMKRGTDVAILAVGPLVYMALQAGELLRKKHISCEIVNCRFIKPMDEQVLERVKKHFATVVTLEEGVVTGGFGDGVAAWLGERGYAGALRRLGLPDEFIPQGSRDELLQMLNLSPRGIVQAVTKLIDKPKPIIV